ncbi:SRPBCC domain-containing protein [Prevotella sp. 10(H)]|uniref:SRPBCC family protein n=1 Tax=Prevotella sp. 10(H) TaxID=1158294 RepID=UPI0004A6DC32|nr:SRPBCC domain-containing protein [Prevotella sp. 10(H)]
MKSEPVIVETDINAPVEKVWEAITDAAEMQHWFFEVSEFKPAVGFEFSFYSGGEEQKFLHVCKVLEVEPYKLLSYSLAYDDMDGESVVRIELSENMDITSVKLTHTGIESFPQDRPDFSRPTFENAWKELIQISLKEYVENK